ncbi:MAG: sugar isomerase domain-containing protein [Anaerolineae bacterium]|nr:sugar isomerase domain-containing protein [Thermoflexales bacterium]MDW8408390.1 sugar isomerase domain-containing protein [Anaerolineae bacterium]
MTAQAYFDAADTVLRQIRETQLPAIQQAGALIADCLASKHIWHLLDQGHTRDEFVGRTGGMIALNPIIINLDVHHQQRLPKTRTGEVSRYDYALYRKGDAPIDYILDKSMVLRGDVLMIHSVSGSRGLPISMALGAKTRGATVIAITSMTYSRALEPVHPSGKRLYEVADLVIDDCGPVGDTLLTIPGMEEGVCASSGLAFVYIMWALEAEIMANLVRRGITPHVFRNANLPGAQEANERIEREYDLTGV